MADIDLSLLTPRDQDISDKFVVMKEGSPDEMGLVDLFTEIPLKSVAIPATPSSGRLKLFAQSRATRLLPSFVGPSGLDTPLQPAIFANRVSMLLPSRSTAVGSFGCGVQTAATISHPLPNGNSMAESLYRARFATSTTAGNASGVRSDQLFMRGNGTTARGGFFFAGRMTTGSIALAGCQWVFGLVGNASGLGGEPSALTNILALAKDTTDTNIFFMHNDGTGAATKINLGIAYATNLTLNVRVFCPPSSSTIGVLVERINNDGSATILLDGTLTTDLPATTTPVAMHCQIRNGSTAAAANIDMVQMYCESDY